VNAAPLEHIHNSMPPDVLEMTSVSSLSSPSEQGRLSTEYNNGTVKGNDSNVKDIWLLGLFPMQGSWAGGLGQLPAVEIGMEHVNADPNILEGYRLRMTVNDTEVSDPPPPRGGSRQLN